MVPPRRPGELHLSLGSVIAIRAIPFLELLDTEELRLAEQVREVGAGAPEAAAMDNCRQRLAQGVNAFVRSLSCRRAQRRQHVARGRLCPGGASPTSAYCTTPPAASTGGASNCSSTSFTAPRWPDRKS